MEITYDTGAKVILQGPVTYSVEIEWRVFGDGKVDGEAGEEMDSGQWSVASKSGITIPSPHSYPQSLIPNPFVIRTPTATVTDLGTEFGVEVGQRGRYGIARIRWRNADHHK